MDDDEIEAFYDEEEQDEIKIDEIPLSEEKNSSIKNSQIRNSQIPLSEENNTSIKNSQIRNIQIPLERILSFKTKLLNNFIDFLSIDDLSEMLQLNQQITDILLKTNLCKSYLNIRKEFTFLIKHNKLNYREMIENAKNKKDLKKIYEPLERKLNFNKYNISQLLKKNCEIIRKYKNKLKLTSIQVISIFGTIIEKQFIKSNYDEININDYNLDNEGVEILNYAISNLEGIKKITLSNNLKIKNISSINNFINVNRMDLKILNLSYNSLDDKFGILLFDKLQKNCPDLIILNLSGNNFTNKVFINNKVVEAFKNNKFQNIKKFIINNNLLTSKGAIQLFDLLLNCPFLTVLDISYNGIEQNIFDSANAINFFDSDKSGLYYFSSFYYEGNFLPSSVTENLVECLLNNTKITYLFLGNNQLNDDSMQILGFLLQNNNYIQSLHINYNNFTTKGISTLFSLFNAKIHIIELNLSNNKITQKALNIIFEHLKNKSTIKSLNLSYNNFSKNSTNEIISNYFEKNDNIKNINLAVCHIGLGTKKLLNSLINHKELTTVDLSVNDIGGNKEIFEIMSNCLKNDCYIKNLYLDGNFINDKDFEKLINDGIQYNQTLNLLSLKSNRINLENKNFEKNLIENIRLNNHIREIRLEGNPIKNEKNYNLLKSILKINGTKENREYLKKLFDQ